MRSILTYIRTVGFDDKSKHENTPNSMRTNYALACTLTNTPTILRFLLRVLTLLTLHHSRPTLCQHNITKIHTYIHNHCIPSVRFLVPSCVVLCRLAPARYHICTTADKPLCRPDQKKVYGVARNEAAHILCEVDAFPPPVTFKWSFNNTAETLDMPQSGFEKHSPRASKLTYIPIKVSTTTAAAAAGTTRPHDAQAGRAPLESDEPKGLPRPTACTLGPGVLCSPHHHPSRRSS